MKRAYFVTGPEGSGNYMMTDALRLAGVQEQIRGRPAWDTNYAHLVPGFPPLVSVMRSLPAAHGWPDWGYAVRAFTDAGYTITPLFMVRELNATIHSQLRRGAVETAEQAEVHIRRAYRVVVDAFDNFVPVSYEAFVGSEGFRRWLFAERLGLPMTTLEVDNRNRKYYE